VRKNTATTGLLRLSRSAYTSPSFFMKGRISRSMIATYTTAMRIVYRELTMLPALAMAITAASMHQAVMSSTAAQVMASVPMGVLLSPRSWMMRASTGKAVTLSEMPTNRAKERKCMPWGANSSKST